MEAVNRTPLKKARDQFEDAALSDNVYALKGDYGHTVGFVVRPGCHDAFFATYDQAAEFFYDTSIGAGRDGWIWIRSSQAPSYQDDIDIEPVPTATPAPPAPVTTETVAA